MGWKPLKRGLGLLFILVEAFYVVSVTSLTLLVPLSFLLLSRLSNSQHGILNSIQADPPRSYPFIFSLFLYTNPSLLHVLVSLITMGSLFHALSGRATRARLQAAWVFLCALQMCVVVGIQRTTGAESGAGAKKGWGLGVLGRAVFFVGVHETMMGWSRGVVRPVVDDAVWGRGRAEKWGERVVMTAACGGLWWMRLRGEVEALAGADFVGCWLYYLTLTIGITRLLKGVFWVGMVVFFRSLPPAFTSHVPMLDDQLV